MYWPKITVYSLNLIADYFLLSVEAAAAARNEESPGKGNTPVEVKEDPRQRKLARVSPLMAFAISFSAILSFINRKDKHAHFTHADERPSDL